MEWYLKCWRQYADFSGRARRSEYWFFVLFNMIISYGGLLCGTLIELSVGSSGVISYILYIIYNLAIFIPGLAVCMRRLHDIGKSGWWLLLVLIPFIGAIYMIVLFCKDSEPGTNQYGENPKVQNSGYIAQK